MEDSLRICGLPTTILSESRNSPKSSQEDSRVTVPRVHKEEVVWTEQEDKLLQELIAKYGANKWSFIATKIPNKTNRHCRRRWQACLNGEGIKGAWTPEEDKMLLEGYRKLGNRWTEIAKMVPGRTDNATKNRFWAIFRNKPQIKESLRLVMENTNSSPFTLCNHCGSVADQKCSLGSDESEKEHNGKLATGSSADKLLRSVSDCKSDDSVKSREKQSRKRLWLDLNSFPQDLDI